MVNMIVKKIISALIVLTIISYSQFSEANYTKRSDRWEASFKVVGSETFDNNGVNGSTVEVKDDFGWGFSLGYNFNPHLLVNFEWTSVSPKYHATLIEDDGDEYDVSHKMNLYNSQVNVVYNFMADSFTPFVQAGVGWSYMDSNISDGPPDTICWWDPWWGYICESYQNTHTDSRLSYNVAAGVRYELQNSMFLRASYQQVWVDLSNASTANFGMYHVEIGSMF
jgi:opacity protein-like surface antigen